MIPTEAEAGFDVRITPDLKPKARRGGHFAVALVLRALFPVRTLQDGAISRR